MRDSPIGTRCVLTQLLRMARFVVPSGIRRACWLWQESRRIPHLPDRRLLVGRILPDLSLPGTMLLWVGCQRYTRPYTDLIERAGATCWTLEIDPSARRWGHPQRHIVGDLQRVAALYRPGQFDVAVVNGVFGYGL